MNIAPSRRAAAALLVAALAAPLRAGDREEPQPDTVTLKNGDVLTGRVVYEDDECVVLRAKSRDRDVPRAEVAALDSATGVLSELLDWLDTLPRDADALVARAETLAARGLSGEARLLRLRAVLLTPGHVAANTALGHKKKGDTWTWKRGHKWLPVSQLDAAGADWDDRWVLDTLHYRIASNLPLSQLLDAAIDLEREQRALVGLFRGHMRMLEGDDVLLAELHADQGSFPETLTGRTAYYDPNELKLFVNAADGLHRGAIAHEATHQLMHVGTARTKAARGELPSWLDEGLAEFARFALRGEPGHAGFAWDEMDLAPLKVQASAQEPYDLKRMLTMDAGDFGASTKSELKYSQACNLVAYGLLGDGGARREGFFRFVAMAWEGHASMSDFRACAGDLDDYEKAWTAWVKAEAKR